MMDSGSRNFCSLLRCDFPSFSTSQTQKINCIDSKNQQLNDKDPGYLSVIKIAVSDDCSKRIEKTMCNDTRPKASASVKHKYHTKAEYDCENDLNNILYQTHAAPI